MPVPRYIGSACGRLEPGYAGGLADALALCYHALSPAWDAALSVTPDRFAAQLAWLARRGYRGVTMSELAQERPRGRRVAVTFDDAFASVASLGRPLLDEVGFPATLYVPTAFMEGSGPLAWPGIDHWQATEHAAELAPLDWDGVRALRDAGWEIGSHTHTHPHLTRCDDAALRDELVRSRELCVEAVGSCGSIAYPYGDVDDRVRRAAGQAGYRVGAGLPALPHRPQRLDWPRVGIYHRDSDARAARKMRPAVRALQRGPLWPPVAWVVRARRR